MAAPAPPQPPSSFCRKAPKSLWGPCSGRRWQPSPPSRATGQIAKSGADAVLIAQGGVILRAIAPTLSLDGAARDEVKLLGTGLWNEDTAIAREATLLGSWYAAPAPNADADFVGKYRAAFG